MDVSIDTYFPADSFRVSTNGSLVRFVPDLVVLRVALLVVCWRAIGALA